MKIEQPIITSVFNLFNKTLNSNARKSLHKIIHNKLDSKEALLERQHILQCFIKNETLFKNYRYSILDQREVFINLEQGIFNQITSYPNPLKSLKNNKKLGQDLKGKTIQFIRFFFYYYENYIQPFDFSFSPKSYEKKHKLLLNYLLSFPLKEKMEKIVLKKFNLQDTLDVLLIINAHYKNLNQQQFIDHFFEFEAFISISQKTVEYNLIFAETSDESIILTHFFHPEIQNAVQNSFCRLNNVNLLTGPNMAGKSTCLRTLGMCIYLHNIGLPVPATKAKIPFYHNIYIFINTNDDLASGYSHFMQEIQNLKEVVLQCKKNSCFVIFDELFKGTNFEDALEISKTTFLGLRKFTNSCFIISTHIHQLKEFTYINKDISTFYMECLLAENRPIFTFKLKEGFSDLKLGAIIFKNENLQQLLD